MEKKSRLGDWEADTIIGRSQQGALVSMVERKSRLLRLAVVEHNKADVVSRQMVEMLAPLPKVQTITSDNGREFAFHERVTARLGAAFYFAHPYCAWEQGLNENTNGLVRQYFPKACAFRGLTWRDVLVVQNQCDQGNKANNGAKYRTIGI